MRTLLRLLRPLGLATLFSLAAPPSAWAGVANIAVASNFTAVARDLVQAFERTHTHRIRLSFGSTGKLYTQIYHGAPFDAFLAADEARPLRAEREGVAVAGSRFTYAVGKLALWSADGEGGEALLRRLRNGRYAQLAIANPKLAPYGAAAKQALDRLGGEAVDGRLVLGENIAQTYQFVATGNAQLGFVALSQVALRPAGGHWVVPEAYYEPIRQQAVLLRSGSGSEAARAFLAYLRQESAQAIIRRHGYGT